MEKTFLAALMNPGSLPGWEAFFWVLGVVFVLAGIAGIFLPAVPGTPLIFSGLLVIAWISDFQRVGWPTFIVLGGLTALSYLVDFAAVSFGAKRFGATKQATWGAVIGMIVGLFFGLPGLLLGPFIGAFIGEFYSIGDIHQAGRAGIGTWLGLALGVTLKLALTFTMIGVFIVGYFI